MPTAVGGKSEKREEEEEACSFEWAAGFTFPPRFSGKQICVPKRLSDFFSEKYQLFFFPHRLPFLAVQEKSQGNDRAQKTQEVETGGQSSSSSSYVSVYFTSLAARESRDQPNTSEDEGKKPANPQLPWGVLLPWAPRVSIWSAEGGGSRGTGWWVGRLV